MSAYAPTSPSPFQSWGSGGPQWWNADPTKPIRALTNENDKKFYTDDDPRAFWKQAGQAVSGGNRQFESFWEQNYDRYMAQYLKDVELGGGQNMFFPDWVTGKIANDVNTQYQLAPAAARGIDSRLYDPGRFDTRY